RTDRTRAAMVVWGGWLVVSATVFSLSQGIIHPYYTVALAPAIGAIVGIGVTMVWRRRADLVCRVVLAVTVAVTAWGADTLLARAADWYPGLRSLVLITGFGAAVAVLLVPRLQGWPARAAIAAAIAAGLTGPTAYNVATASTPHSGAIPAAGPSVIGGFGRA